MEQEERVARLSWPPSTNQLWRSFNGRNILSKEARQWFVKAGNELLEQGVKPVFGPVEVSIELCSPFNRPFDLDNRTKAVLDILVKSGVIEGDGNKIVRKIAVSIGETKGATVTIRSLGGGTAQI